MAWNSVPTLLNMRRSKTPTQELSTFSNGLMVAHGVQASNVATYIAHGDVALSVLMTTASTVGAIFMTPTLTKLLAGALVPVDAWVRLGSMVASLLTAAEPAFCAHKRMLTAAEGWQAACMCAFGMVLQAACAAGRCLEQLRCAAR